MKTSSLRTQRLLLRPFDPADAPRVQQLAGDREIALNTIHVPHPYPTGRAQMWIDAQVDRREQGQWDFAIDDGELAGCIGLRVQEEFDRAEIGYWIGKPYWGRGYATEAAAALIRLGFEELNLNRIYAGYFSRNAASARVMIKNGMQYEGTLRQHVKKWGEFVDIVYYGILRSDWSGSR